MHPIKRILIGCTTLCLVGLFGWLALPAPTALGKEAPLPPQPAPDLAAGKEAFETNCVRCHGATGGGDGMDSKRMSPRPRKLSEGIFKFRTTASGTLPTDEDLFRTISQGLPGSRMPEFQRLPEETRWQPGAYVKTLSPAFQQENQKPERVDFGADPGPARADVKRGKELYTQLGCATCHGTLGRADGPSSPTLVDNWGQPIRPADLTHGWSYRAGSSPRDIVNRLMTGVDGTPMPSYIDALSKKEDAWHLAYYIQSLQEKPDWKQSVEAAKLAGALPATADDAQWQKAPKTDLRLSATLYNAGEILPVTVTSISVQAVYNDREILFRLAWHDANESGHLPPDACAILFLPDRHLKGQRGSMRGWPAASDVPPLDVCYWSAQTKAAREAVVHGTDGLESGTEPGTPLWSQAHFAEGEWMLLMKRPLGQKPSLCGVAVWNGGNGEQGRRRGNSNWIDLNVK